jgi:hypothetical protein
MSHSHATGWFNLIFHSVIDRYMRRLLVTGMVMYVSDMTGPAKLILEKTV